MTAPTPDAQSSRFLPRRPQMAPPSPYATPTNTTHMPAPSSTNPPSARPAAGNPKKLAHEHAIDFATHSWDLATGGLKTLTAKRELPVRPDRRSADALPGEVSRGYMFIMIILVCVVLMLLGGGIVLIVMLQP